MIQKYLTFSAYFTKQEQSSISGFKSSKHSKTFVHRRYYLLCISIKYINIFQKYSNFYNTFFSTNNILSTLLWPQMAQIWLKSNWKLKLHKVRCLHLFLYLLLNYRHVVFKEFTLETAMVVTSPSYPQPTLWKTSRFW